MFLGGRVFWANGPGGAPRRPKKVESMANAFEFIQQVRAEAQRVVWPTRRETLITTAMVVALGIAASLFLMVVDFALEELVSLVLGFGRHG